MKFLFLGNGSYNNHGCEAIVLGTLAILRQAFGETIVAANGISERKPVVDLQEQTMPIEGVQSFSIMAVQPWAARARAKLTKALSGEVKTAVAQIEPHLGDSRAMLALGGDNFSLEYGVPYPFLGWNALARDAGLPTFLWGASVGPFRANPRFERQFVRHAQTLSGIFVRETETLAYLTTLGLGSRLHLVADPAFAMEPVAPRRPVTVPDGAIGLNLSPLMAEFVAGGSLEAWTHKARQIIVAVARASGRPIVLIPHVNATSATRQCDPGWQYKNDHGFLQQVSQDPSLKGIELAVLDDGLSAPELKSVIARLWAFAGARTHATIAAFSTQVPCVSFAYSVKARGLNKDVLGSTDFCIPPRELSAERVVGVMKEVDRRHGEMKERYADTVPGLKASALRAGDVLKASLEQRA